MGPRAYTKAIMSVLQGHACVQRCQYHKHQNGVSCLSKSEQTRIHSKMEAAYGKETYKEAKAPLDTLKPGLKLTNQTALSSLEEGLEETLTLHRLGMMPMLKDSFHTTNCIENVKQSHRPTHKQRRALDQLFTASPMGASALLDTEPRLRRVKSYRYLPMLRHAIQADLGLK